MMNKLILFVLFLFFLNTLSGMSQESLMNNKDEIVDKYEQLNERKEVFHLRSTFTLDLRASTFPKLNKDTTYGYGLQLGYEWFIGSRFTVKPIITLGHAFNISKHLEIQEKDYSIFFYSFGASLKYYFPIRKISDFYGFIENEVCLSNERGRMKYPISANTMESVKIKRNGYLYNTVKIGVDMEWSNPLRFIVWGGVSTYSLNDLLNSHLPKGVSHFESERLILWLGVGVRF